MIRQYFLFSWHICRYKIWYIYRYIYISRIIMSAFRLVSEQCWKLDEHRKDHRKLTEKYEFVTSLVLRVVLWSQAKGLKGTWLPRIVHPQWWISGNGILHLPLKQEVSFNRVFTKIGEMYTLWPSRDEGDFMRHGWWYVVMIAINMRAPKDANDIVIQRWTHDVC